MKGIKYFHEFSLQQEKSYKNMEKKITSRLAQEVKKNFNLLIL